MEFIVITVIVALPVLHDCTEGMKTAFFTFLLIFLALTVLFCFAVRFTAAMTSDLSCGLTDV